MEIKQEIALLFNIISNFKQKRPLFKLEFSTYPWYNKSEKKKERTESNGTVNKVYKSKTRFVYFVNLTEIIYTE